MNGVFCTFESNPHSVAGAMSSESAAPLIPAGTFMPPVLERLRLISLRSPLGLRFPDTDGHSEQPRGRSTSSRNGSSLGRTRQALPLPLTKLAVQLEVLPTLSLGGSSDR